MPPLDDRECPTLSWAWQVDYIWTFLIAISEQKALVILTLENKEVNQKRKLYIFLFLLNVSYHPFYMKEIYKFWVSDLHLIYHEFYKRVYQHSCNLEDKLKGKRSLKSSFLLYIHHYHKDQSCEKCQDIFKFWVFSLGIFLENVVYKKKFNFWQ